MSDIIDNAFDNIDPSREEWIKKLTEGVEKITNEMKDKFEEVGPVGGGLYYIGGGCYTGKAGWDQFNKLNENEE
jgi:hypothetical protein